MMPPEIQEHILSGIQLPVMEHFYTIQGEGAHSGRPAYFVRLGGCDVGCHWCDVKESWDMHAHPQFPVSEITGWITSTPARACVITGGEPLMHNLQPLTQELHHAGISTWLETSGAYPLSGHFDWICVSPKKFKPALDKVLHEAHELKIVIFHPSDLAWAESFRERVPAHCRLYLQPEWDKSARILPLLTDYVKQNPVWTISLQTHKYMNIP